MSAQGANDPGFKPHSYKTETDLNAQAAGYHSEMSWEGHQSVVDPRFVVKFHSALVRA